MPRQANPAWADGRGAGWLTGPLHTHFVAVSAVRAPDGASRFVDAPLPSGGGALVDEALPLRRGDGLFFGAHGLTVGFPLWLSRFTSAESDAEHARHSTTRVGADPRE